MTKNASKWEFLSEETWNKHTESKTVQFDESRFEPMSDLNWVTDVETDISIKNWSCLRQRLSIMNTYLHPPPTSQSERNPLEKVPWSKMIESYRKRNFLIYNGGVR